MNSIFNRQLIREITRLHFCCFKRYETTILQYDLSEEIVVGKYEKILTIGLNFPHAFNVLNDNALDEINEKLKEYNSDDKYSVALLHGIGGNFCTGIEESASLEKAERLLKTLGELKKPTVASLTGRTCFYGFQLAIMCDLRVMEMDAVLGLGYKCKMTNKMFPICREYLLKKFHFTALLDIILTGGLFNYTESFRYGLINRWTETGTGLGKTLKLATTIAKYPLKEIIEEKAWIYSAYNIKLL